MNVKKPKSKVSEADELQIIFRLDKENSDKIKKLLEVKYFGMSIHTLSRLLLIQQIKDHENEFD